MPRSTYYSDKNSGGKKERKGEDEGDGPRMIFPVVMLAT
jgi:hypothetical protein